MIDPSPIGLQVFVVTKMDLEDERKVTRDQIDELARQYGAVVVETSAKSGFGVPEAFHALHERISEEEAGREVTRQLRKPKSKCAIM